MTGDCCHRLRKLAFLPLMGALATLTACATQPPSPPSVANAVETIVFIRHGEKPPQGLGQLNCQGLNRALALPAVLTQKFGRPSYIFAPDPSQQKPDRGVKYDYIRPLATIEPTAIQLGLPVNTQYGSLEIDKLQRVLLAPQLANATVFVAWEHVQAELAAKNLLSAAGANPSVVPWWDSKDFNSIYVVHLRRTNGHLSADFTRDSEGLDHLSPTCPSPALNLH